MIPFKHKVKDEGKLLE